MSTNSWNINKSALKNHTIPINQTTVLSNTLLLQHSQSIVWVPLTDQFWCLFGWRETVLEHLTPNTESWTAWRRRTRRNTRQRTGRHRQASLATGTGGNRPTGSSAPDVSACTLCGHPSTPPFCPETLNTAAYHPPNSKLSSQKQVLGVPHLFLLVGARRSVSSSQVTPPELC